jgi:hypothetical protein
MSKQSARIELAMRELEKRHEKQRKSLYEFIKFYREKEKKETLDENRHIKLICDKIQDVHDGKVKRLMINVPPRSLKTQIVSIAYPAWAM